MEPDDQEAYDLVMPFILTKSQGGPYDDDAFVAGWRLGQIDAVLAHEGAEWSGIVPTADLPQADLLAMRRDMVLLQTPTEDDEWTFIRIHQQDPTE